MIKLEDLLAVAKNNIAIMNGSFQSIVVNVCHLEDLPLPDSLLKRNIKEMEARPKCFNCKHYHPDPGFFEICGCDCNNFSKYEDKNKVVTFNEF